jgi:Holliday junction resolvase RusA-like endonuclease
MIIELGHLPDRDLSPNRRLHFMQLYAAKRDAKDEATALVLEHGVPPEPIQKAHIAITWVAKDKRRRDIDNLFSSMKAYIDGLVRVGLIADDSADHVEYTLKYERGTKDNTVIEVRKV